MKSFLSVILIAACAAHFSTQAADASHLFRPCGTATLLLESASSRVFLEKEKLDVTGHDTQKTMREMHSSVCSGEWRLFYRLCFKKASREVVKE
jgi:hypothetical protein